MKTHHEEQMERLRQQAEEASSDLVAKEKELKKLRYSQLIIDT